MLTTLSIRDVVLIERLDLSFAAGLTVLTGETAPASRFCWIVWGWHWARGPMRGWCVPGSSRPASLPASRRRPGIH